MQKYLKEIRENRVFKANEILRKNLLDAGVDLRGQHKNLLRDISLIQNRSRGKIFELMAEVIIGGLFRNSRFETQLVFKTPYGRRRIDLFVVDHGIAIEVKSGYVRLKKYVRDQIRKDNHMLQHDPRVGHIIWACFRGATAPTMASLEKNGVEYYDIGYDKFDD